MSRAIQAAIGSIVVGFVVLALKVAAWWITGSIALYSDALESIINIVTAVAALVALLVAARPADANHPYGHHKAEYLSAVIEGVLIIVAAFSVFRAAYEGLQNPVPIDAPLPGLLLSGLATLINAGWAAVLIRAGRRLGSPALAADGRHLLADVATSVAVIAGLAITPLTGWAMVDPILAMLVAVNILWTGYGVVRSSVGGLMDEAVDEAAQAHIREIVSGNAEGAIEAHDLRTRRAGRRTFVEFHLVVAGDMRVGDAHAICDRIETALREAVPGVSTTIHVEPEEKAKHRGIVVIP